MTPDGSLPSGRGFRSIEFNRKRERKKGRMTALRAWLLKERAGRPCCSGMTRKLADTLRWYKSYTYYEDL